MNLSIMKVKLHLAIELLQKIFKFLRKQGERSDYARLFLTVTLNVDMTLTLNKSNFTANSIAHLGCVILTRVP